MRSIWALMIIGRLVALFSRTKPRPCYAGQRCDECIATERWERERRCRR